MKYDTVDVTHAREMLSMTDTVQVGVGSRGGGGGGGGGRQKNDKGNNNQYTNWNSKTRRKSVTGGCTAIHERGRDSS